MAKSTKRRFLLLMNLFICFALLLCISACGSGGGRSDDEEEATTNNSKLTLEISSNTVTFGTPVTLTATLTNASGNHEPNTVVTFVAADSSLVTFTPVAATALTNDNGQATITLNAASIDSEGATSITASAPVTFQGATVTTTSKPLGVTVGGATVSLAP
jgi:lipopolysaccharide export system protein LptC